MSIFKYLRSRKKNTASVAKERLQIIIAHERKKSGTPDFLPRLQREIVDVIAKYINIDRDQVKVQLERTGNSAVLELNITMPEEALTASSAPAVSSPPPRGKKRNRRKEKARAGA